MLIEVSEYDEEDRPWGPGCAIGLLMTVLPWAAIVIIIYWMYFC